MNAIKPSASAPNKQSSEGAQRPAGNSLPPVTDGSLFVIKDDSNLLVVCDCQRIRKNETSHV
jgi:hypothetical protein